MLESKNDIEDEEAGKRVGDVRARCRRLGLVHSQIGQMMFGRALVFVVIGMGISAVAFARTSRGAPPPRGNDNPSPPSPPSILPSPPAAGYASTFAPVKADTGSPGQHRLTAFDLTVTPEVFALAAGFSSIEELIDANPNFSLIDAPSEGWPPFHPFAYIVTGTSDIFSFSPTWNLDDQLLTPTFKSGDADWIFPLWASAKPRSDMKIGVPTFEGHRPVTSSSPTHGRVFTSVTPLAPFFRARGITGWSVGNLVNIKT